MTEEPDKPDVDDAEAAERPSDRGRVAGQRLADARRDKQITVHEIAKELHLDEPKVRALESNDFDVLGAPVFAKGHLRKYAGLVGVPEAEILGDYFDLTRSAGLPPVVGKIRKHHSQMSPGPWIAAIVVVIVIAAAYWWFVERDDAPVAATIAPNPVIREDPMPVTDESADLLPADDDAAIDELAEPVVAEPAPTPGTAIADITTEPQVTLFADGDTRLTLRFSGDCWTEVTDAGGRRLFFDLGRDGRVVNVAGPAPLSVLLGNADNVVIAVDGVDYPIRAADRRGQTARLTIQGS